MPEREKGDPATLYLWEDLKRYGKLSKNPCCVLMREWGLEALSVQVSEGPYSFLLHRFKIRYCPMCGGKLWPADGEGEEKRK